MLEQQFCGLNAPPGGFSKVLLPSAGFHYTYTQAAVGGTSYGLTFDPLAAGTTTVSATGPAGVVQTGQAVRTVVVNP